MYILILFVIILFFNGLIANWATKCIMRWFKYLKKQTLNSRIIDGIIYSLLFLLDVFIFILFMGSGISR